MQWIINIVILVFRRELMNYEQEDQNKFQEELKKFIQILKQEIFNPQIFTFQALLFKSLNKAIKDREERLKMYLKPDVNINIDEEDTDSHKKNLKQAIFKCEMEKIQYLLKEYLRVRLRKIEKYCFYFYKNQNLSEKKLSENEYVFMKKYAELKFKYYQENVLKTLPRPYRGMGGLQSLFSKAKDIPLQLDTKQSRMQFAEPQSNDYIFCTITANPDLYRFNTDIPVTNVQQKSIIPINSTIYTQYKYVSKMISEGNAVLI